MHFKNKKAFTLVEMLIVIVIIGILAAALIPRLMSARGRANDTARKAHLQQIATALITSQLDRGVFPPAAGDLSGIAPQLQDAGMTSIPTDPDSTVTFSGIGSAGTVGGQYRYTPVIKNGSNSGGFVIMAKVETEGGANYVVCDAGQLITGGTDIKNIYTCNTFTGSAICNYTTGGSCSYLKGAGQLRYIYVY